MKDLKQYVGRIVKGVKFDSKQYNKVTFVFVESMEKFVGEEGVISEYYKEENSFRIDFKSPIKDYWYYPVEVILPQLEGEPVGYLIEDEVYAKIIAGLVRMPIEGLLQRNKNGCHFAKDYLIYNTVVEYGLLDKCTPVYKSIEVNLPKINGYKMEDVSEDSFYCGCAELLKAWFDSSTNRSIVSMTLDSGVVINKEQINKIQEYLLSKEK